MPIRAENKTRYPKDWKLRSLFVRVYRARNRCEWCGAKNGEPHPITGSKVVLTTAHVFDHRPEAASLLNLAALCQRCQHHRVGLAKLRLLNLAALCQRCHNRHDAKMRQAGRKRRTLESVGQRGLFGGE